MPTNDEDKKPNILELFKDMLDDHLGKKEFTAAFEKVIQFVNEADAKSAKNIEALAEALTAKAEEIGNSNASDFATHKAEALALVASELARFTGLVDEKLKPLQERIDAFRQVDEDSLIERAVAAVQMPEQKEALLDTPEDIRNKLEVLNGDERLEMSAIKGLEEILASIRKESRTSGIGGAIVGRNVFQDVDLSARLDGSTKTFGIPAVWNIISVHLSSFPHALRKNVDFTYTPESITFTSEIDAATSLAAGQTCVLTVVTA